MPNSDESSFRESLLYFKKEQGSSSASLSGMFPKNINLESVGSSISSWTKSAAENINRTSGGWIPVSTQSTDQPTTTTSSEGCFGLTKIQRFVLLIMCSVMSVICYIIALFSLPTLIFAPQKFALTYTMAGLLSFTGIAVNKGFFTFVKHMVSQDRLYFTLVYIFTTAGTLYAVFGAKSYILTLFFVIIQLGALVWYYSNYLPFRANSWFTRAASSSMLPI
jgi:hypothetical protein